MAKTYQKVIIAGVAGLAAGLAIGILIAPEKGSRTRKRLRKKFLEMEEKIRDLDLPEKLGELRAAFSGETEDEKMPE